ncbi:TPA: hypothetical protein JLI19_003317 [Escherichia coli]|nr:hypothetical protein [Escherichia coli]HCJ9572256.1 hypothetical protein [Escherichia coli]HDS0611988.1 hypothetical protein [Escherichia coli]
MARNKQALRRTAQATADGYENFIARVGMQTPNQHSASTYLTVKAAGVWAGGIETPSVETPSEGSKFFGFDMDNEFISGFDVGAWGVLL